jgi:hypothetical protein
VPVVITSGGVQTTGVSGGSVGVGSVPGPGPAVGVMPGGALLGSRWSAGVPVGLGRQK